jgi:cell cycle checkpoint protein
MVTDVTINTFQSEGTIDFQFAAVPINNRLILKSKCLKDAFNELDWSSTSVCLLLSPDEPFFRLTTAGDLGSCQVDYSKESDDVFDSFECKQTQSSL